MNQKLDFRIITQRFGIRISVVPTMLRIGDILHFQLCGIINRFLEAEKGRRVSIDKTWNLFMSVAVPEGHHTWEMKFFPAWMNYGLMISAAALTALLVFMVIRKNRKPMEEVLLQTPAENPEEIKVPDTEGSV